MKVAKNSAGQELVAEEGAPRQAICLYCEGVVLLRGRRIMGSDEKSYYWRHMDNQNRRCPGRARTAR